MKKELLTLRNEQLRLERDMETSHNSHGDQWHELIKYGNLLDLPLTLSQFIPCKDGKPLEEPRLWEHWVERWAITDMMQKDMDEIKAYQNALDAVIFEGFSSPERGYINNGFYKIDIIFLNSSNSIYVLDLKTNKLIAENIKTLSDLAQATTENPIKLKTK